MRLLTTITLLTICFTVIGQSFSKKQPLTFYPGTYIDFEKRFTDSTGISVIIQNSFPKGGGYTDPTGKSFGYRIFWARIINETDTPLELTINFPADSFGIPSSYLKLFLPTDTMTLAKETLHAYGATGLKSFLDAGLNKPTLLQRTINPKDVCLFYIGVLYNEEYGPARAELILKEQVLFYSIRGLVQQLDSTLIPCGRIALKN